MKTSIAAVLLLSVSVPTAVAAKGPPTAIQKAEAARLKLALNSMVQHSTPPGQMNKVDHDQGDDHASARAIEVVCTKDTPAASRSAICPAPISPE